MITYVKFSKSDCTNNTTIKAVMQTHINACILLSLKSAIHMDFNFLHPFMAINISTNRTFKINKNGT